MPEARPVPPFRRLPLTGIIILALAIAGVLLVLMPNHLLVQTRILAAWDSAVIIFLVLICLTPDVIAPDEVTRQPTTLAYGRTSALIAVLSTCIISVGATTFMLRSVSRHQPGANIHAYLSLLSVLSSWFLLQAMFALFYARNYYVLTAKDPDGKTVKGLLFNTGDEPDFWDFMYFSFTVGITYATSDTPITSRAFRRAVLLQSVISFLFYTVLIGLLMNVVIQVL